MSFISETASAIKGRFGFHDRSSASETVKSVRSSPDLLKSVSRPSVVTTPAIRSFSEPDEDEVILARAGSALPQRSLSFDFEEDPSFWKDHNVQVIIRVRPLSNSEISVQGKSKCVRQESRQAITWIGPPESRFTFDLVADENVTQEKLFFVAGLPMVENCVSGYNSCMFAYGQTGSGKTHTMLGDIEGGTRRHSVNCGMTPRVFEHLFSRIQKEKEARKDEKLRFTCKCSFLEIYNEQILDLLDPSSNNLQLREDIKKGVHVENLKEIEVTNARDVLQQLIEGAANRKVAATNMNHASSRSHSVFTCIIESEWESQGVTHHRFARLNLVDLAGSERQKSSGAEGERLKEATNINKSLSTLGLVIMNLVNISNGKSQHVPYRDSKLTFLLQDSLGGNSKTTIIANISPSICCSLETLSTLKFAQRAKFIKNNAIINEDASGDVIAMRLQIQQLKKEVARLRNLANGVDTLDGELVSASFPASPISLKSEGFHGFFSPLVPDKKMSQKKDFEVALVGAFKREKEKETARQALAAENQAAMLLAKQREDEIQSLKMRLRFRESTIKRLEAVAGGKISAETHLLKEKEEYLREIEVLRAQVDRNQEVTRFAMENLRLKEELRRLKSFSEDGERERMNEQIEVLQNQLLEALNWKQMHEPASSLDQLNKLGKDLFDDIDQELGSQWRSSMNEENEFLRLQAIHNQSEMDTLRKKLSICLDEKEILEKRVNGLLEEFEKKSFQITGKEYIHQTKIDISNTMAGVSSDDQIELKAMVDAIAAASEKEAEAHERAIKLSRENDDLRLRVNVLIQDNNKLIELYDEAVAKTHFGSSTSTLSGQENSIENKNFGFECEFAEVKEVELKKRVEDLEHQLAEMHEENDKLLGLYENAMQEKDEFKRTMSSGGQKKAESTDIEQCPERLVEVNVGLHLPVHIDAVESVEATEFLDSNMDNVTGGNMELDESIISGKLSQEYHDVTVADMETDGGNQSDDTTVTDMETKASQMAAVKVPGDLNLIRMKLERAQETLSDSTKTISIFTSLEKSITDIDRLSREMQQIESGIQEKQHHLTSHKILVEDTRARQGLTLKKLSALKVSLSNFVSSVAYFEQREARARGRVETSFRYLSQKKESLLCLESCQREIKVALAKIQQSEAELKNKFVHLKIKLDEENQRQESEKVLFSIDNIEKTPSQRNWQLSGKATDLLKSEEEKTKVQVEIKLSRDKLGAVRKEIEDQTRKSLKLERESQNIEAEIEKASKSLTEMEDTLQNVIKEKETLYEMSETGKIEIGNMIVEYHQLVFECNLREVELKFMEEELQTDIERVEELVEARATTSVKSIQLLEESKSKNNYTCASEKIEEELQSVWNSVFEAKVLLLGDQDTSNYE